MVPIKPRQSSNNPQDSFEEMDIEESFRYVQFLLMWYRNRSSINLANTIVHEIELIKQKVKDCEDGSKDKDCERLFIKAMKLFYASKGIQINWPSKQGTAME